MDLQTIVAIAIVILAALWGAWMLASPFIAALRPKNVEGCGGACSCSKTKEQKHG